MPTESKTDKWISALKPVLSGLVALMAAAALFLNSQVNEQSEHRYAEFDRRLTIVETQTSNLQGNLSKLSEKTEKILEAVTDIKVDMAKLAALKK